MNYMRNLVVAALLTVLALTLAACGGDGAKSTPTSGATNDLKPLVIARDMDINSLDPSLSWSDTGVIFLVSVYQTLLGVDPKDNQTLIPRLASKWSFTDDMKQYTFELNPAAKFDDGSPVESKDVKFSLERLANIKGSPSGFMDGLQSIDASDPHKVVLKLSASDSSFLAKLSAAYAGVMNSEVAIANGATSDPGADKSDKAEPWFQKNSAGSGPYKLVSYQQGAELRLTRNENYWGDKPAIKDVIMKQVKDAVSQRQLLEGGDVDIAMQIDADTASKMKSGGDVTVQKFPTGSFVYLSLSPGAPGLKVDLNVKIRQAIRLAIDYTGMIDITVSGSGRPQASAIPNGFLGSKDLALPKQDLEKAKQLLAEGGQPNGFEIEATYPTLNVYGVDFATMMQKVQSDLAKVGIKVKLQPAEDSVWIGELRKGYLQMSAVYYAPDHTDPSQYIEYFGMTPGSAWSKRVAGDNPPVINQKEVDLLAKAKAAANLDQRGQLYTQLGQEMINEGYIIPLVNPDSVLAYRSNLQGVRYAIIGTLELWTIKRK
jgi:peptide/nickel transport system substrate-binding protein